MGMDVSAVVSAGLHGVTMYDGGEHCGCHGPLYVESADPYGVCSDAPA